MIAFLGKSSYLFVYVYPHKQRNKANSHCYQIYYKFHVLLDSVMTKNRASYINNIYMYVLQCTYLNILESLFC